MPVSNAWSKILRSLETQLSTIASATPIQSPNVSYKPTKGTPYMRSTLLPAATESAAIGLNGTDFYSGLYQVDVFAPRGLGSKTAIDLADEIVQLFVKGTVLVVDSFRIRIQNGTIQAPIEDADWYQIPVIIEYFSHGEN